ncbi:MAG: preprotein translocase subunit Sec61beta [Hadesarchaea archaeon]|nr:preprotein translocase subunit Sec61beta [Hadesarchaea archaeon]
MARSGGSQDEGMPATGAGLIRYFKDETHGIKVSPYAIVGMAAGIIIFEILLRFYGEALLGF